METKGNVTKKRVGKALDYLSHEIKSSTEDYTLVADIVLLLLGRSTCLQPGQLTYWMM